MTANENVVDAVFAGVSAGLEAVNENGDDVLAGVSAGLGLNEKVVLGAVATVAGLGFRAPLKEDGVGAVGADGGRLGAKKLNLGPELGAAVVGALAGVAVVDVC